MSHPQRKQKSDTIVLRVIKKLKKVKNSTELREELLKVLQSTINGSIDSRQAQAIARLASVIITSTKVQVEYKKMTGKPKKISFLE